MEEELTIWDVISAIKLIAWMFTPLAFFGLFTWTLNNQDQLNFAQEIVIMCILLKLVCHSDFIFIWWQSIIGWHEYEPELARKNLKK